jgi:DNA primase
MQTMSINYRRLRESLRIDEVLSWMSWKASSRAGDQLRGPCPFCDAADSARASPDASHGDRSFSVNTQRNIYHCFRCSSSGNALDLWSSYRKLSIYAAAQEIQARLHQNKQP